MDEQKHVQLIRDAYAAFVRGDIDYILARLTDDVQWRTDGPAEIPYAGTYSGKAGAIEFFRKLASSDDVQQFEPQRYFADGDMVVVLGHYAARVKATGNAVESEWVHVFTFRDDKVSSWREYLDDTAKYAKAYAIPAAL